jgi:serine/threonine-protein kinase
MFYLSQIPTAASHSATLASQRSWAPWNVTSPLPGGEFSGSPGYIAPELIKGFPPTPAADVYSFGIVLYEMIAMTVPFDENQSPLAIITAKVQSDAPDVRQFKPGVDERIAARLAQSLSRESARRPVSARAVLAGIEDLLRTL